MKLLERGAPVAALAAALSTLACCIPLGFLGALGLASFSLWISAFRWWILGAAVVLLAIGFLELYLSRGRCTKRSGVSVALFWTAVVVIIIVSLFPQLLANWIAG